MTFCDIKLQTIQIGIITVCRPDVLQLKSPRGLRDPLMISGTIQGSPLKLCTVIVLLEAYQNTERNFKKSDL